MSGAPVERPDVRPLRLPELGDEGKPGARLVRRAVSATLGTLALLAAVALAAAFLVRMDVAVEAAGTLEPVRIWSVRSREAGVVEEVRVQAGDTVRRGELLARLDALQLRTELEQLRARHRAGELGRLRASTAAPVEARQQADRLAQAGARLVTARAMLRQRMVEADMGGNADSLLAAYRPGRHVALDLAVAEVRSAEAELRLHEGQAELLALDRLDRERLGTELEELAAQIRALEERIERLGVPSPTAGVVLTEGVERLPGAYVREGDLLLEVAEPGGWRASLLVRERDVSGIWTGAPVRLEVPAFEPRGVLQGRVVSIAPEPVAGGGEGGGASGTYRVVASLDPGQLAGVGAERFRRGYTVEGRIVTRSGRIVELAWDYLSGKLRR